MRLEGAFMILLDKNEDSRGFFSRLWCENELKENGLDQKIVQINNSLTKNKGVVRGLHFQKPPMAETKLVRCISGSVWDVIVDLRRGSPTYGKYDAVKLSKKNRKMVYIPKGFAHGFQTLKKDSELIYFHSEFYSKNHEQGIIYNDKDIGIKWPLVVKDISIKDKKNLKLKHIIPINI